ncbi:LOW QUALITY PROTEIN: hypothetical protein V1478_009623 [Vespula squamosa]|uniref:Transmembrane protein n=1 Tax=Vespula squamosa TaxID=30214 RepID=A0ABD2AQH6_VESSQ
MLRTSNEIYLHFRSIRIYDYVLFTTSQNNNYLSTQNSQFITIVQERLKASLYRYLIIKKRNDISIVQIVQKSNIRFSIILSLSLNLFRSSFALINLLYSRSFLISIIHLRHLTLDEKKKIICSNDC